MNSEFSEYIYRLVNILFKLELLSVNEWVIMHVNNYNYWESRVKSLRVNRVATDEGNKYQLWANDVSHVDWMMETLMNLDLLTSSEKHHYYDTWFRRYPVSKGIRP